MSSGDTSTAAGQGKRIHRNAQHMEVDESQGLVDKSAMPMRPDLRRLFRVDGDCGRAKSARIADVAALGDGGGLLVGGVVDARGGVIATVVDDEEMMFVDDDEMMLVNDVVPFAGSVGV